MSSALVVGAGVFGAALADRLVAEGWEVTLVDRFEPGDPRSESGGETRLLRFAHGADAFYSASAWRARASLAWSSACWSSAAWSGSPAARTAGRPRASGCCARRASRSSGWSPARRRRLFPSLAVGRPGLRPARARGGRAARGDGVRALVARAREGGLRLVRGEAQPDGDRALLDGRRSRPTTSSGPAAAGWRGCSPSWSGCASRARRSSCSTPAPEWAGRRRWIDFDASAYGHGLIEPYGMKVASDREGEPVEPGLRPPSSRPTTLAAARDYLAERFPALAGAPVRSAPACHYSLTARRQLPVRPPPRARARLAARRRLGPRLQARAGAGRARRGVLAGEAEPEPRFGLGERAPSRALRTAGS